MKHSAQLLELYATASSAGFFDRSFIRARAAMLPILQLDRTVPRSGKIIEIGCGHGLITNYLALSSPKREMIGVDVDVKRIEIARATIKTRTNIKFLKGYFQDFDFRDADMVILFGVLCVIPFPQWSGLFASIRQSLKEGGSLLLHDVKKEKTLGYWIHEKKEDLFRIFRITQGEGFFVLEPDQLEKFIAEAHFKATPFSLNVPYHSCLNYLLRKEST
ncbi:MAG: class I SAM-dependent methyltransferase [Deltaproteobacteria bacterium]|nr:class I SAM-dependent methyltransferase [Deltaproteobacteria bacterium]